MQPPYDRLRERSRQIVSQFPPPDFYGVHPDAHHRSRRCFESDPALRKLRDYLAGRLEDDFGHGMRHAAKVALDAGALVAIEGLRLGLGPAAVAGRMRLVQCAALLHDIHRKRKDHAKCGAQEACRILAHFPFTKTEVEDVRLAILNHEAFKPATPLETLEGALVSNCLYDADKFRWGPDNFTDTLWEMVAYYNPSLTDFLARYPRGMATLSRIKSTFRTATGRIYGPQFIDLGLAVGRRLYRVIREEFAEHL